MRLDHENKILYIMIKCRKVLTAWAVAMLACGSVWAQESEFDLTTQRSESQDVLPVPGKKLDHGGIVVNPTPHQMTLDRAHTLDLSQGVNLKDRQGCFLADVPFLTQQKKGVKLSVDFGTKVSQRQGVKPVSGAYRLKVDKNGIEIVGYDERGAFYGLQTLRQLVESPAVAEGRLPYVEINDYPDLKYRGVVEGFYGTPWSHEVRMSLIDFYGKFKMNSYLYGPKDDPYHSCPNWRLPYPEQEAEQIKGLIEACRRNRVDFVWAIHPGQDIKWNEEDYQNLVNKFNWMYDLGVRAFALFFDDISGEGTNPVKQTELLNRLTTDFVKTKGDVAYLTVCPTDYSKLWANPTPQGPLAIYGETLDPSVEVFWTGDVVCSDLTPETMAWVNSRIKRPAYFWWNYPVTDYVRHIILQGPVYGLDTTLTAKDLCGIASNPMEHGEASKLALYGVADYTWNVSDYNPIDNWERGLGELMPEAREAYRTFAIHSCDTENGYRRDESWETRIFRLADWNDAVAEALWQEFDRVEKAPGEIERGCTNRQLVKELGPWLQEFEKLGARGKRTIELARLYRSNGDRAEFWNRFVQNLMSDSARADYETHKVGTMKLQPFYENAMDDMAHGFLARVCGETPLYYKGIGSFSTVRTPQAKLMLDHDTATYYTSGIAQKAGDWIGLDLGKVEPVIEVSILQGRNSVDDVDYFDHAVVEYSVDGKTWKPLTGELKQQYIIDWQGEAVQARYVRLKRLESARTNYAAIRSFEVNPPRIERLGFDLKADDVAQALYLFDGQLATSYQNRGMLTFGVKSGVKSYMLLMNDREDNGKLALTVKQLAADGSTLAETEVTTPFHTIELLPGAATIQILGEAEIFEIVPVKR